MKDSGIEWIGEIPEDWKIDKMNRICSVITDYVASGSFADLAENVKYLDEPDYAMLVRTMDVSNKGYSSKPVYINEHAYNYLKNSNLFGGELLLPNIGGVGEIYIVPKLYDKMSLAPNSIIIKTNYYDKYYYYFFYCEAGALSIKQISQSTAQLKFNKTQFKQIKGCVPPLLEQQKIADFLDEKCSHIDSILEKTKASIDECKQLKQSVITQAVTKGIKPNRPMKDSGIEWIGEIPEDWDISKVKREFSYGSGLPITKENLIENGVPVISYGQIHAKFNTGVKLDEKLYRYVSEDYLETNSNSLVNKYDFIFADTSEDLEGCGNCAYISEQMTLFAGYHTIILHSKKAQDNRYIAYLFKSPMWRNQITSRVTGIKVFSISKKILNACTLLIPSFAEQIEIANYLDLKCSEIDKLITKKEQLIKELETYKKSLIYEYVTGKKEVI